MPPSLPVPSPCAPGPEAGVRREIRIPGDTRHVREVREAVAEVVRKAKGDAVDANILILAVDEAVTNIIEHAYDHGRVDGWIQLCLEAAPDRFEVVIRDTGRKFDPSTIPDPNIEEHLRKGRRRGLGVFLMRQIMDEIIYNFRDDLQNELTMIKYFT